MINMDYTIQENLNDIIASLTLFNGVIVRCLLDKDISDLEEEVANFEYDITELLEELKDNLKPKSDEIEYKYDEE